MVYDAPPDLLVGWGGGNRLPIPHSLDAFGISPLDAFGVSYPTPSVSASLSPHFQKSGYAAGHALLFFLHTPLIWYKVKLLVKFTN